MLRSVVRSESLSALVPTVRIVGALTGIVLIHAAFLADRPVLGFLGVAIAFGATLATNLRLWLTPRRFLGLCIAGVVAGLLTGFGAQSAQRYVLIGVPILAHLSLSILFGLSLLPGRTALITCFSRVERAPVIDPVIERYTRLLTWIWVIYFAAIAAGAVILVLGGRLTAASWITSVLSPAIGGLLFFGEHVYRYLRPAVFGPTSLVRTFRSMADPEAWRLVKQRG